MRIHSDFLDRIQQSEMLKANYIFEFFEMGRPKRALIFVIAQFIPFLEHYGCIRKKRLHSPLFNSNIPQSFHTHLVMYSSSKSGANGRVLVGFVY